MKANIFILLLPFFISSCIEENLSASFIETDINDMRHQLEPEGMVQVDAYNAYEYIQSLLSNNTLEDT